MVILLLVVFAYIGYRALNRDNEPTPVRTVDYRPWVAQAHRDGLVHGFAPEPMPKGWRATSVNYLDGATPRWHLGVLTDEGNYVGVEESRASTKDLVGQYVDDNATKGPDVRLATGPGGAGTWTSWSDSGGDYALSRQVGETRVLVVGTAPAKTIRTFTAELR